MQLESTDVIRLEWTLSASLCFFSRTVPKRFAVSFNGSQCLFDLLLLLNAVTQSVYSGSSDCGLFLGLLCCQLWEMEDSASEALLSHQIWSESQWSASGFGTLDQILEFLHFAVMVTKLSVWHGGWCPQLSRGEWVNICVAEKITSYSLHDLKLADEENIQHPLSTIGQNEHQGKKTNNNNNKKRQQTTFTFPFRIQWHFSQQFLLFCELFALDQCHHFLRTCVY